MEKLTLQKLYGIKKKLENIEKKRQKYYDENGEEYILLSLKKKK